MAGNQCKTGLMSKCQCKGIKGSCKWFISSSGNENKCMYYRNDKDGNGFDEVCDCASAQCDKEIHTPQWHTDREYERLDEEEKKRKAEAARLAHQEWLESQEEICAGG